MPERGWHSTGGKLTCAAPAEHPMLAYLAVRAHIALADGAAAAGELLALAADPAADSHMSLAAMKVR